MANPSLKVIPSTTKRPNISLSILKPSDASPGTHVRVSGGSVGLLPPQREVALSGKTFASRTTQLVPEFPADLGRNFDSLALMTEDDHKDEYENSKAGEFNRKELESGPIEADTAHELNENLAIETARINEAKAKAERKKGCCTIS